ncbi:unnamed protein product [Brassicogethes aeneus]|uniref:Calmodulin n=1 Tax=Brassicogethes aeneus TaxID=1431903 RepID=A0A9P0ASE2_BRAAE|nr:unnamed protein product [Brassicogethes aeneus]
MPQVIDEFTDEQIENIKEAFGLFDDGSDTIAAKDLTTILRSLGTNPTPAEIEDILHDRDPEADPERIGFNEFTEIFKRKLTDREFVDELIEVFRQHDKDKTGTVPVPLAREILKGLNLYLNDEEIAEMVREINNSDEEDLDYVEFMNTMTQTYF